MPLSTCAHGPGVVIRGGGVAASCCARLLADAGIPISLVDAAAARVPAILLGEGTQALLRDLYGRSDLFDGLYSIERRIVQWGEGADPVELPHRAVVIPEGESLERLADARIEHPLAHARGSETSDLQNRESPDLQSSDREGAGGIAGAGIAPRPLADARGSETPHARRGADTADCSAGTPLAGASRDDSRPGSLKTAPPSRPGIFHIYASRPLPAPIEEHAFGTRMASATAVEFARMPQSACWIESLDDGWLFLLPDSPSTGWLLSVGNSRDELLSRSRLIAAVIRATGADGGTFPAHPRIADPPCAPGWLACGAAAMAFDPICGDGAGAAVREAILSTAVIRAIHAGGDVERLLAHYRARLIAGLLRHLQLCRAFYTSGGRGPWWGQETAALDRGIAWCDEALRAAGPFRYRLRGLELETVG